MTEMMCAENFRDRQAPTAKDMSKANSFSEFRKYGDLSDCTLCPRSCHVNRLQGETGFCGEGGSLRAARAALYYNEEPVISGNRGSGAVFFTGCCLGCIYCQNREISRPGREMRRDPSHDPGIFPPGKFSSGRDVQGDPFPTLSPDRLAEIFFELEEQGAHNINLVTPEHFVPLLIPALRRAKREGLSIPIVYNTGSFERVEAVRALEGLVDVWMPDLKYVSSALSAKHIGTPDYFRYASAAIAEMVRQCPEPVFSDGSHAIDCPDDADDPLMLRGVLVRHLALPGCAEDSRAVLRYLRETYGDRIFISLMNQYTPMPQVMAHSDDSGSAGWEMQNRCDEVRGRGTGFVSGKTDSVVKGFRSGTAGIDPNLFRTLSSDEYDALVDYAIDLGIVNGFIQESGTVSPSYIPVFDGTGI